MKPICVDCHGEGQTFDGVFMQANPGYYGDYDEVWTPCHNCNGTGKAWRGMTARVLWSRILYHLETLKYRILPLQAEDEIPF